MTANGLFQLVLYVVVLIALAKPLGAYMARVYAGRPIALGRVLGWLERLTYRLCGVGPDQEMGWKAYAGAMLLFNLFGMLAVYLLQRVQGVLPLNPQGFGAVSADSSFNTAASFATNTNWQGYTPALPAPPRARPQSRPGAPRRRRSSPHRPHGHARRADHVRPGPALRHACPRAVRAGQPVGNPCSSDDYIFAHPFKHF
jgi:hypothetical protein